MKKALCLVFSLVLLTTLLIVAPVITTAAEEVVAETVHFIGYDGRVIITKNISEITSEEDLPEKPIRHGYIATGWDCSVGDLTAGEKIAPNYVKDEAVDYRFTILGGELSVSSAKFDGRVTATATDPGNFAAWVDDNGEIVSTTPIYTFYASQDMHLEAKNVGEIEVPAYFINVNKQTLQIGTAAEKFRLSIVAESYASTGYTIVERGILYTTNTALTDSNFVINHTGVKKKAASTCANGQFMYSLTNAPKDTDILVKAYMIVEDANGVQTTVYSGSSDAAWTDSTGFAFGENVAAGAHKDGSAVDDGVRFSVDGYSLVLNSPSKVYVGNDLQGNAALKLGTGSEVGTFSFQVPNDVTSVIFEVAGYKDDNLTFDVNGTTYQTTTVSNNGAYNKVTVDTTDNKTVVFATTSTGYRAMIKSISFVHGGETVEEPAFVTPSTATDIVDAAYQLEKGETLQGGSYTLTGTVVSSDSGLAILVDELGTKLIGIANLADTSTIEVGDTATVTGSLINDAHIIKFAAGCTLDNLVDNTPEQGGESGDASEITFEFGEDNPANTAQKDGSTEMKSTTSSYESNGRTLTFTAFSKVYPNSYDAKGNAALKLGSSSAAGSFTFTVEEDVKKVIIMVAGRATATAKITVNGTSYTISTLSNNGEYTAIEVDTTATKTIDFTTVSGGYRCMIDSITYMLGEPCKHTNTTTSSKDATCTEEGYIDRVVCDDCSTVIDAGETVAKEEHDYEAVVTYPTCTAAGYTTYTCSVCGDNYKDDETEMIDHDYVDGVCSVCGGEEGGTTEDPQWQLVTDASTLAAGDKIIIVAKDYDYALGTTQNKNNRAQAAVTKGDDIIPEIGDAVQVLTLEAGTKSDTFAFNAGSGYLYAASSGSNYLRTEATLSANSSWNITIAADGTATIKAQGTNTRNWMRYNSSSKIFACYASGQLDIVIYKLS